MVVCYRKRGPELCLLRFESLNGALDVILVTVRWCVGKEKEEGDEVRPNQILAES